MPNMIKLDIQSQNGKTSTILHPFGQDIKNPSKKRNRIRPLQIHPKTSMESISSLDLMWTYGKDDHILPKTARPTNFLWVVLLLLILPFIGFLHVGL